MRLAFFLSMYFALLWALSSCGFEPVYGDKDPSDSLVMLSAVEVKGGKGRYNELLVAEIKDLLNPARKAVAKEYVLQVSLDTSANPVITEADGTASRIRMDLVSPFILKRIADGKVIHTGKIKRQQSYNISENADYASMIAQRDVLLRGVKALARDYQLRMGGVFATLAP